MTETLKTINAQVKKCMIGNNTSWKNEKCLNLVRSLESINIIHRNKQLKLNHNHSYYVSNLLYDIVHCGGIWTVEKRHQYGYRSLGFSNTYATMILKEINVMAECCIHNQSPEDIDTMASLRLISQYHNIDLTDRYYYHQYIADRLSYIIEEKLV